MTAETTHTCSYSCERPGCIRAQRDYLAARLAVAQQPAAPNEEAAAFDANFLRHIASVCRAAYDLCQPKPQRTPEDVREYNGGLCLSELTSIADEIERRLAAVDGAKETDLWRCTVCGRVGTVGRCCGEETREPFRPNTQVQPCRESAAALAAQPAVSAEPVAWVAADTLNSPHPTCVSSLAYMSQLDKDRGREYVPLYAAPMDAQQAEIEALRAEVDALARENEAMRRCAIKYLGWLGVTHKPLDAALREDMANPDMCGDAALAQEDRND